ncbi:lysis system i-spanin subunit Rz [Pseudomonas chlororaphis]|uniref:lysis system i-spanin subunit Rz n=1 Tax=Pseudomonas chlororaphis TaxID=587753 RepID=UPI000F568C79|nr:lysis system i-spanin subunit Rz [Pseudomonas chlororaphis]WDG74393.1 lysis system i-spanin subunit Rz [Pseudomonas chlororaphis]WDH27971.1 lysis system i-spanin subunit Rz [Pseudomonas chlororaphis]WDH72913.1 lysis system i-spanin subunit Rz [Pseudomonas chlororaphis]
MRLIELIPAQARLLVAGLALVALLGGVAVVVWTVQDWRYGRQLEQQARLQAESLNQVTLAAAARQREEQDKRLALEQRLQASDQTHYRALSDAQRDQGRLRDRLATADLRLSVLLDAADSSSGCAVPAATAAAGVVHGAARARLDPAHAQRIIGITNDGDQGLIALAACQAYVREISNPK